MPRHIALGAFWSVSWTDLVGFMRGRGGLTQSGVLTMSSVTMRDMLNAGVHFGHQTRYWNPKMNAYIFGAPAPRMLRAAVMRCAKVGLEI